MARRKDWDLKAMSVKDLEELVRHCDRMERRLTGGYSKGRRGWTALRADAVRELEVRESDARSDAP
jgi:hypothetical protein